MVAIKPNSNAPAVTDIEIVREANECYKLAKDWQGVQDQRSNEDRKFANADARNAQQWPTKIYNDRAGPDGDDLPCLTINTTRVHNDMIINSMSKNGYGIKIRPTGGKASYKSAQVMQSLVNRIENISKFGAVKRKISEHQVDGGIGYVLIETAYVSDKSFDQEIYLLAAQDPSGVMLPPWIKETDGSDAEWGLLCERQSRRAFNRKYPQYANKIGSGTTDSVFSDWISEKEIMLVKYYRRKGTDDTFIWYKLPDGTAVEKLASEIREESGDDIYKALMDDIKEGRIEGKTRPTTNNKMEWFLIAGDQIVDQGDWAGKYVPICRCVGRETVIDGTLDRKGHTRPLIDANRMLNYNASMAVEIVALQPKSPFMAPARSIEGQEQYKELNIKGFPVLLYNDIDEEAPVGMQKIDAPQRINPPTASEAHVLGMQQAERQMMMISGQFQAQMGQNDGQSASSGRAINERQEQGDTATYHFPEHQGDMLRYIGTQLLDLIPKIYDTERVLHIEDDHGEKYWIKVDPKQEEVLEDLKHEKEDENAIKLALNPAKGEYECVSDPGPDYASQRQEAWNAISLIVQQNTELAATIGDLLFKYGDFPGADEIAERLLKEIKANKPYLFDENLDPQLVTLQEQNKRLVSLNAELMEKIGHEKLKTKGYNEKRDIDAFNAETQRMKTTIEFITKTMLTPQLKAQLEHELTKSAQEDIFSMIRESNQEAIDAQDREDEGGRA